MDEDPATVVIRVSRVCLEEYVDEEKEKEEEEVGGHEISVIDRDGARV